MFGIISIKAWQATCAALACALTLTVISLMFSNHFANKVKRDLAAERDKTELLKAGIDLQNSVIKQLKQTSDARTAAAEANIKLAQAQTDTAVIALSSIKAATAKNCTDAMPALNAALKGLKHE